MRQRTLLRTAAALGLALAAAAIGAGTAAAQQRDSVTVTGGSVPLFFVHDDPLFPVAFHDLDINAQSDPSGANASGTASFGLAGLSFSGPVCHLSVTGPDRGAGTATSPTTALFIFRDAGSGLLLETQVVDNGGNGKDLISGGGVAAVNAPCSPSSFATPPGARYALDTGRAVVFDAPLLPTSKDQCKKGGWQDFGDAFRNQGQCVAFVERGAK